MPKKKQPTPKPEEPTKDPFKSQHRFLIERYYLVQEHRIAIGNQINALRDYTDEPTDDQLQQTALLQKYFDTYHDLEKQITKDLTLELKSHLMWEYLKATKGIGTILGASLISYIDIHKAQHASSVWKYAGLDVAEDGEARSKRKEHLVPKTYTNREGEVINTKGITFNPFLKKTCWLIGESFVKTKGTYRNVYNTSKEFYQKKFFMPKEIEYINAQGKKAKKTIYTKGHIHAMAKRRTVKLFLAEFWAEWRALENLPVSKPFMHRGE